MAPFVETLPGGQVKVYLPESTHGNVKVYRGTLGVVLTMDATQWQQITAGRDGTTARREIPAPSAN